MSLSRWRLTYGNGMEVVTERVTRHVLELARTHGDLRSCHGRSLLFKNASAPPLDCNGDGVSSHETMTRVTLCENGRDSCAMTETSSGCHIKFVSSFLDGDWDTVSLKSHS